MKGGIQHRMSGKNLSMSCKLTLLLNQWLGMKDKLLLSSVRLIHLNVLCICNSRTILLSVISLLNEPNTSSPANVDASVMYRRWKDSKGADSEYANIIKKQVSRNLHDTFPLE